MITALHAATEAQNVVSDSNKQPTSEAARRRLPNRRRSLSFNFECGALRYSCTASWLDDGTLGEVFLGNHRADSQTDACAKDAAILASIALQYHAPFDVLRKALLRDSQGRPSTPIGCALDLLASEESAT